MLFRSADLPRAQWPDTQPLLHSINYRPRVVLLLLRGHQVLTRQIYNQSIHDPDPMMYMTATVCRLLPVDSETIDLNDYILDNVPR